ncbi:MAG: hypothetical protein HY366_01595 [Candidatus Aenigmarchaeota archaeon]|nr:hypothetical protein [Candidatus Aenigmarchaeota archaeon]
MLTRSTFRDVVSIYDCDVKGALDISGSTFFRGLNINYSTVESVNAIDIPIVVGNLDMYETRVIRGLWNELEDPNVIGVPHVIGNVNYNDRTLLRDRPYRDGIDEWHLGVLKVNSEGLTEVTFENLDEKEKAFLKGRVEHPV